MKKAQKWKLKKKVEKGLLFFSLTLCFCLCVALMCLAFYPLLIFCCFLLFFVVFLFISLNEPCGFDSLFEVASAICFPWLRVIISEDIFFTYFFKLKLFGWLFLYLSFFFFFFFLKEKWKREEEREEKGFLGKKIYQNAKEK